MPNAKVLEEKKALVAQLAEKIKSASAGVLVDYKGITVANDTKLRKELREAGVEYGVVKNTMLRFAANEAGYGELSEQFNGTTSMAISPSDPIAAARIINDFSKKNNTLTIKAGFVDGKVLSAAEVGELAAIPSKEVLIARVLAGFNAPITGLVMTLNAIAEKMAAPEAAEAPADAE